MWNQPQQQKANKKLQVEDVSGWIGQIPRSREVTHTYSSIQTENRLLPDKRLLLVDNQIHVTYYTSALTCPFSII